MFLGIDPTSSESKTSACAVLDDSGALAHLTTLKTNTEILELAREWRPSIVAIDAPLGFPKGMCCVEESCPCQSVHKFKGRVCERELIRRGIRLYITTKRSFIKGMIYRSIALARELTQAGSQILEVYPYASKVYLFGRPIPPKTTREGLRFLHRGLAPRIPGLSAYEGRMNHDAYDSLVAAYTAYLHALGKTETLAGPGEEVPIVVPMPA